MKKITTTRTIISGLTSALLILPTLASAVELGDLIDRAGQILNALIALLVTLAIVVFFWGLITYLQKVGDEKQKGLTTMFYGIIAIFVMVALWGLIGFVSKTLGIDGSGGALDAPQGPDIPGSLPPRNNTNINLPPVISI